MAAAVTDPAASAVRDPDTSVLREVTPSPRAEPSVVLDTAAVPVSAKQVDHTEHPTPHPSRRVKIYILNEQGNWEDRGTGHVWCHSDGPRDVDLKEPLADRIQLHSNTQAAPLFSIRVISEETGLLALRAPIRKPEESFYNLQGDTIISWSEDARSHTPAPSPSSAPSPFPDKSSHSPSVEMALSFADATGCREVWEEIARAQEDLAQFVHTAGLDLSSSAAKVSNRNDILTDWDRPSDGSGVPWVDDFPFAATGAGPFRQDDVMFGRDSGSTRTLDGQMVEANGIQSIGITFPPPQRSSLQSISRSLAEGLSFAMMRERIAAEITENDFIDRLLDLFSQCEDVEDDEGLKLLYDIVKTMFSLGSSAVLDKLLKDHNIMRVVGALEYEHHPNRDESKDEDAPAADSQPSPKHSPDLQDRGGPTATPSSPTGDVTGTPSKSHVDESEPERPPHRHFLKSQATYRPVVAIKNQSVLAKIHQNFRVLYIKDIVLARVLDDVGFTALNSLVYYNNVDIVMHFLHDKGSLEELFVKLTDYSESSDSQRPCNMSDLLKFLLELCTLSRALQPNAKSRLFLRMFELGLFDVCLAAVKHANGVIQQLGTEIFAAVLHYDQSASTVRWHMINGHMSLMGAFVHVLCSSSDSGVILHVAEILRTLLENESMGAQDKDKFLNEFYSNFVVKLLDPLSCKSEAEINGTDGFGCLKDIIRSHVCDLLTFCVQNHAFRAKYFVLQHNVGAKVLALVKKSTLYVGLAALRFFRACIGVKDDFYFRYIVKNQLLDPVVEAFLANVEQDNLLSSAVMELVDFLHREKIQTLLGYLVDRHPSLFEAGKCSSVFVAAKETYAQLIVAEQLSTDEPATGIGTEPISKEQRGGSSFDNAREKSPERPNQRGGEEAYFNSDDFLVQDLRERSSGGAPSSGLGANRTMFTGAKENVSTESPASPPLSADEGEEEHPGSPMDVDHTAVSPPSRILENGEKKGWRAASDTTIRTTSNPGASTRSGPPGNSMVSQGEGRLPPAVISNTDQPRPVGSDANAAATGGEKRPSGSLSLRWQGHCITRVGEASSPKDGTVSADSGDSSSDGSRRSPMSTALTDGFEVSSSFGDESSASSAPNGSPVADSATSEGIVISTSDLDDRKKLKAGEVKTGDDGERKRAKIEDA